MQLADDFRATRRKKVKKFGKRLIRRLRGFLASQSLVSNDPVLNPAEFPFLKPFEERWQEIHGELMKILEHKESVPAFEEVSSDQKRIAKGQQWRTFILYGFGAKLQKNCAHAPVTTKLLEQVPTLQTAWFSILEPGYNITAHKGVTKGILRVHLGLVVPDDRENCYMRVEDRKCPWEPGKLLVFDDTYDHEVRNDTPQERVVLLFDFVRPMRFWGRVLNWIFIQGLKMTAYYQEPKARMKGFEEQFEAATRRADRILEGMGDEAPARR
ncbi:aspartyl/asparaginyl beta-hydroxylase domain-containing protein [Pelagibius sp. CAU 1746]|uniref:aspartyl/asparaginyl beta-hydroxylase domain-containing protein n=1 Tax=Pelagibius sp. CAU 1746 TaxID=3140370 RepID=UPI00325A90A7